MGLIDRLARRRGYVKPDEVKTKKRGFEAAKISRLVNSWTTTPQPIDADIHAGLQKLVARSREQAINNDYVRRFLALTKSNVVGPNGVTLQARSKDPGGTYDTLANDAIEAAFRDFCKKGSFDVTGKLSFVRASNLFIETVARDGEVLVLLHENWRGNRHGFAVEFIDTQALDVDLNEELKNGNTVRMGVELDAYRRPVAYYLRTTSKTAFDYETKGRKYRRVPASRVIHAFLPESVFQTRGFPWLVSCLMRLNMLHGYEESELVAARVGSAKMGFFTSDPGAPGEYTGEKTDAAGNIVMNAEPGTFEQLPEGVRLETFDPTHPASAYDSFIKATLRGIAAGLGVSYFSLANDLEGVNYSSGRLGTLEDRELWKSLQNWLIEEFCEPIFERWLSGALLRGVITVNDKPLAPSKIDKYRAVSWQPRRWSWTDPQKEMSAYQIGLQNNLISASQIIREQGRDPDEVFREIAKDREKFKELNIEPAQAGFFNGAQNDDD